MVGINGFYNIFFAFSVTHFNSIWSFVRIKRAEAKIRIENWIDAKIKKYQRNKEVGSQLAQLSSEKMMEKNCLMARGLC